MIRSRQMDTLNSYLHSPWRMTSASVSSYKTFQVILSNADINICIEKFWVCDESQKEKKTTHKPSVHTEASRDAACCFNKRVFAKFRRLRGLTCTRDTGDTKECVCNIGSQSYVLQKSSQQVTTTGHGDVSTATTHGLPAGQGRISPRGKCINAQRRTVQD